MSILTDARFSGVSTGACVGHIGPEALAGGPISKVRDGDLIQIVIDRNTMTGGIDLVGEGDEVYGSEEGVRVLDARSPRDDLSPHPALPNDTRLWAALQGVSGGTWGSQADLRSEQPVQLQEPSNCREPLVVLLDLWGVPRVLEDRQFAVRQQ